MWVGVDECTINVHYYYAQHDPLFSAMQVSCMQVRTLSMSHWFHMSRDTHHYQSPVSLYVYKNTIHYQCQFSRFFVCCCCHVCNDTTHYQCQVCVFHMYDTPRYQCPVYAWTWLIINAMFVFIYAWQCDPFLMPRLECKLVQLYVYTYNDRDSHVRL